MQIATYVVYKLLIRPNELNTDVGDFVSCKKAEQGIIVHTTSGQLIIPKSLYHIQFVHLAEISTVELLSIL